MSYLDERRISASSGTNPWVQSPTKAFLSKSHDKGEMQDIQVNTVGQHLRAGNPPAWDTPSPSRPWAYADGNPVSPYANDKAVYAKGGYSKEDIQETDAEDVFEDDNSETHDDMQTIDLSYPYISLPLDEGFDETQHVPVDRETGEIAEAQLGSCPLSLSQQTTRGITNEQVLRQMQKTLRDGQELSRQLSTGTREWWAGPKNAERRRRLSEQMKALREEFHAIHSGEVDLRDQATQLALDGIDALDEAFRNFIENPAETSVAAFTVLQENTRAVVSAVSKIGSMRQALRGELGSQSLPFRFHLSRPVEGTNNGEEKECDSDEEPILVELGTDTRENALCLQSTEDWEVL